LPAERRIPVMIQSPVQIEERERNYVA